MKRIFCITLVSASLFSFPLSFFPAETENPVIVRVNGTAISERDLHEKVNLTINRTYFHKNLSPEKKKEILKQSLEALIEEELMFQESKKQQVKVDKKKVDQQYAKVVQRFPSKEEFKNALKKAGYTEKELKQKINREFLIKGVYKRNIIDKSILTEQELRSYYDTNKNKFKKPETVNLQLILIKIKEPSQEASRQEARQQAESLLIRLKKGEDFGSLASQYSDDMYRIKGGHLGEVHRGRLPKEIEATAFTLKKGEISPPIKTEHGFSIIKLLDKKEARQLTFNEIKNKLKSELEKKRIAQAKKGWITNLKAQAKIEIYIDIDSL